MQQITPLGTQLTVIHFATKIGNDTRIACMPNMKEFGETQYHPVCMHSDDPRAVSCPACKKTDAYKMAVGAIDRHTIK